MAGVENPDVSEQVNGIICFRVLERRSTWIKSLTLAGDVCGPHNKR